MKKIIFFAYYWTYFNITFFITVFFIWMLVEDINYPEDWKNITPFTIVFDFVFISGSPLICLYMRDKFDLLRMEDGKGSISQGIWVALSLSVNAMVAMLEYAGISEILK